MFIGKYVKHGVGYYFDADLAQTNIDLQLDWTNHGSMAGSKQWAMDPGTGHCNLMSKQNATSLWALQKHHVREFQLAGHQHDKGVVAMSAHRDIRDHDCGFNDTVPSSIGYKDGITRTGFNVAQREFLDAFDDLAVGYQDGPGSYTSGQCDPHTGNTHQVAWNGRIQFFDFSGVDPLDP